MRFQAIAYPLVILMDCIIYVSFFSWQQQAVYEFNQRQMDLSVNYAVDAAVQEMLANGTHIGTDYVTWGEMNIEPEIALKTYLAVLIRNLGWSDSDANKADLIETSMPFFCVAVYDGYYMYSRQHEMLDVTMPNGSVTTNSVYQMRWTPKLPYSETVQGSGDSYIYYFYNLGQTEYGTYRELNDVVKYDNPINRTTTGPGSLERSMSVINDTLTDACNSALYAGLEGNVDAEIYIPASFSEWSNSNPVQSPSVITYMSRADQETQYDVVTFGIGGAKIDDAQFCVCYDYNGSKLYTYADRRHIIEARPNTKVEQITTSPEEAARAGYYFDTTLKR